MVDFSEAELRAYSVATLVFFFIALVAALIGLRAPGASGLILICIGGTSLVLAVFGTVVWLFGGLLLIPFGFIVLLAGVVLIPAAKLAADQVLDGLASQFVAAFVVLVTGVAFDLLHGDPVLGRQSH